MPDSRKHLLLVEDEAALRETLAERLAEHGFEVEQADTGERAIEQLADFAFDIVVTDLRLPGLDGTRVLEAALLRYPDIIGIIVTGYGTVKDAVEAIKRGATDFVTKPFQFDELLHALSSALEQRRLRSENAYLRSQLQERYKFEGIIGRSPAMRVLFGLLETVSSSASTILVTGETGSGKEIVARAIHHNSPRRAQRFVALNCGAIPETLLEAELFGHVRGAFTGAIGTRQGRLEQAHKGTLFLDEVGTMSAGLQMKLLRVLQEREFERLGDTHSIKVDVRVVAATNSDLKKMVAEGQFREDLFSRLNVIPIELPPLRDRKEDIPKLAHHFVERVSRDTGKKLTLSPEALSMLVGYPWPGNVRELQNAIERAVILADGEKLLPRHLNLSAPMAGASVDPWDQLDWSGTLGDVTARFSTEAEKRKIAMALKQASGDKGRAADLLQINFKMLTAKMKQYGLD
jgi:DNA-binding NtrC family response regulator